MENIPAKVNAVPVVTEKCSASLPEWRSPSARNRPESRSPSHRNAVRLPTGIAFGIDRIHHKISSRDLRSNDQIQVDLQEAFKRYNFYYERKVNQCGLDVPAERIVVNEAVAQAFLAVVLKKPSDARRRKYKVWGEMYERLFSGQVVEPYIVAVLLERAATRWVLKSGFTETADDLRRKLANNGLFHLARTGAFVWRKSDNWPLPVEELRQQINTLETNSAILDKPFSEAFGTLEAVVRSSAQYQADLDTALKSATLEADLDKTLHS